MSDLNLDQKVVIKNMCEWDLFFKRIESPGEVKIPKKGVTRLSRGEIQAQVYANNTMLSGLDGQGSHAKLYIEDKDTRVMLGFESEDGKQEQDIITPERIQKILAYKTQKTFENKIQEEIKLDSEKLLLVEEAKRQKLNDYEKIKFIEEYTEFKFKN
ncbi:hypothetical protein [Siminovitchia fordii]|uniref:Uncharacterized protein n=1 Tax=Siminovitchia fordii TaxID=254759 RepID=A0ABQ4KBK6_9BACI|nr:hypothetical protein [Siminovitchia fordii]GIN23109.1 hypothetical protein J1TS3_42430 [Siminovitchia fordii]